MHFGDYTFIFLLALVLFGPKKLPEMGRQLGKLLAEFRRASNEFKFQIQEELRNMEEEERKKKLADSLALAAASDQAMIEAGATKAADAGPTILPPSTGEPVSTGRPFAAAVEASEAQAAESAAPETAAADADGAAVAPESHAVDAAGSPAPLTAPDAHDSAEQSSDAARSDEPKPLAPDAAETLTHG